MGTAPPHPTPSQIEFRGLFCFVFRVFFALFCFHSCITRKQANTFYSEFPSLNPLSGVKNPGKSQPLSGRCQEKSGEVETAVRNAPQSQCQQDQPSLRRHSLQKGWAAGAKQVAHLCTMARRCLLFIFLPLTRTFAYNLGGPYENNTPKEVLAVKAARKLEN